METQCLQNQYFTRSHDLKFITHLGDTILFPRSHFLYKPGSAPAGNDPIDPGFGYGSLRWPQIDIWPDKPNPQQDAFNTAVKTRAAQLAVPLTEKPDHPVTFDTGLNAFGVVDAYFTIEAANDRFIDVTLADGTMGWGAAHPNSSSSSFLWWLDRSRPLTAEDVFVPNSGWQQILLPLAIASLQSNTNLKNDLWKGDQLTKAVEQGAPNPRNWTVTHDGLTITFAQYAVGPYFIGMPQANIPWSQLTPMLEPTLNPSTLPQPNH